MIIKKEKKLKKIKSEQEIYEKIKNYNARDLSQSLNNIENMEKHI